LEIITTAAAMAVTLGVVRLVAQAPIETLAVQGQISMIAGVGGNVTVLDGPEGVMLVDAGRMDSSDGLIAAVRALTPRPIHFIINTNADADHVGGNAAVAKAGRPAPGSNQASSKEAPIYSHEKVLNRMAVANGNMPVYDVSFWPTVTFFTQKRSLYFNSEPIE